MSGEYLDDGRGGYEVQVRLGFPDAFTHLLALSAADAASLFPSTLFMISKLAEAAEKRWRGYAEGSIVLPNGTRVHAWTGTYVQSIHSEPVTNPVDGSLIAYVIKSDDPKAQWIETGTSPWDMRKILNTSRKVRRTSEGTRYLIIPFRWGTPGTLVVGAYVNREMPENVHEFMLSRVDESVITGSYEEPSVLDPSENVTRNTYKWGGHLTPSDLRALGIDPNTKPGRHMVGMYRMNDPEAGGHAQHVTFRTLSDKGAPGTWIHPGTEGKYVAEAVAQWVERTYPTFMRAAVEADVARMREQFDVDA